MSVLLLVLLLLLIALNGLFVAAEFALVRVRQGRIEQLAEEGNRNASRVLAQLKEVDEYLSAAQVGITMASIGIGFLGEPAIARLIEPAFGSLSHGVATGISVAIAFTLVTSLHISVGERRLAEEPDSDRGHRDPDLAGRQVLVDVVELVQDLGRAPLTLLRERLDPAPARAHERELRSYEEAVHEDQQDD